MKRCLTYNNRKYQDLNFDFRYSMDEYRIVYVSNAVGRRYIAADVVDFDGEELLFLAPGIPYCYYADYEGRDSYQLIELGFSKDFLGKAMSQSEELSCLEGLFDLSKRVVCFRGEELKVFSAILESMDNQSALDRLVSLLALLSELKDLDLPCLYKESFEVLTERNIKRLGDVLLYINTKYRRDFRADKMASVLGLSPVSLSRFAGKFLGKTIPEYVNEMRVNVAKRILLATDLPLDEVAKQCGYGQVLSFQKNFQKLVGEPASLYRKRLKV